MTQVIHSEDEFKEIENRAETLHMQYLEHKGQSDKFSGGNLTTKDRFDYWVYVATKERIAHWYMHNE